MNCFHSQTNPIQRRKNAKIEQLNFTAKVSSRSLGLTSEHKKNM